LISLADEACGGFGLPAPELDERDHEYFLLLRSVELLNRGALVGETCSLCAHVDPQLLAVLPKMRTPQVGLTLRSMTHHLALCPSDEVTPIWNLIPTPQAMRDGMRFNLFLIPYPFSLNRSQFSVVKDVRQGRHRLPPDSRFFAFSPNDNRKWIEDDLADLVTAALQKTSDQAIHGVVLPELSLNSQAEFLLAYDEVQRASPGAFLVAGVYEPGTDGGASRNTAYYAIPFGEDGVVVCPQAKHHPWRFDGSQIIGYGLQQELEAGKLLWEHMEVEQRQMNFFALKRWLTFGVLVCEDLARQEPVSRLVRAVAPNLLIALLMDGPQIAKRWPARYASVLAEDPGCSVLSLTSRGMVALTEKQHPRPAGCRTRQIALWSDVRGRSEIPLEDDAGGVVLSLTRQPVQEHSADGRSHEAAALVLDDAATDVLQIPTRKKHLEKPPRPTK
jgi:hypothetical protein